jgi:hypothetical protein
VRQVLRPGYPVDFLTPDEFIALQPRSRQESRVRSPASIQLDANGNGKGIAFEVEVGYEFEARRIVLTLGGNIPVDPNTGAVLLNVAGKFVAYLRSDSLIEYGQPQYASGIQIPGIQTWSREQGPYLRNGEVFQVQAAGLTANAILNVYLEGILVRPGSKDDD